MKKIAYFECPTGIAGDMCLGALIHGGVPLEYLIEKLDLLGISQEYQLRVQPIYHNGLLATKVYVDLAAEPHSQKDLSLDPAEVESPTFGDAHHHHHHPDHHPHSHGKPDHEEPSGNPAPPPQHRHLPEIVALIKAAHLPQRVEAWSLAIFQKLAAAEGAVHGVAPEQVHFHEVGATDAIIDIVGTCLGLDWLGIDQVYCSPMPIGGGTVWAAHGRLPVPTPAVLKLWELRQVPVYSNGIDRELVTPTGAALAVTLAKEFGQLPPMIIHKVGLGAGSRQLPIPNVLRLWIGEAGNSKQEEGRGKKKAGGKKKKGEGRKKKLGKKGEMGERTIFLTPDEEFSPLETIAVLETQIDDLSPQAVAYTLETLLSAGALDVFTQPITMKKSRQGILLTVICHPENLSGCQELLFRETTTLGVRYSLQQRTILQRQIQEVETEYGVVRLKVAGMGDTITHVQPEYEDCAALARQHNLSWREIHRIALQKWHQS